MEEVNEAADIVADVAEAVSENAEELAAAARGWSPRDGRLFLTGTAIGLFGGVLFGYGWAGKRLRTQYEQIAEQEIDEMREHFRARLIAKEEKPDLAEKAQEISEREGYSTPQTPVKEDQDGAEAGEEGFTEADTADAVEDHEREESEEEAPSAEVNNLFDETKKEADEGWDYEEEVRLRRPDRPYVIHVDERSEKDGYTDISLIYYEADDVLADERDQPIEDRDKTIGEGNLDKFGHGSHDKDIVYIRNDLLKIEIEVIKNDGSYAEVVHGFVQHSNEKVHRRPHFDDEDSG